MMKMKNKKWLILIIISIIIIGVGIFLLLYNGDERVEKVSSNNKYTLYELKNMKKKQEKNNVIIWFEETGKIREEYNVKKGINIRINKFGVHNIKITNINNNNLIISVDDLAPTKKDGSFSLTAKYNNIVIKKNTGLQLNVQAIDLYEGYIYLFYVPEN